MERLFKKELLNWFNNDKKPLMVIGARQIGKTYLIDKFCKENFKNYLYFNLEKENWLCEILNETIDPKNIINLIEVKLGYKLDLESTVMFFDEVQTSERFITSLKYFCEYEKHINVICAGSLLGVKINRFSSSFPVGKVTMKYMYPMNFLEFLMALKKDTYIKKIKEHSISNEKIENFIHEDLLDLYRKYLLIGGMPESVKNFIDNECDILLYNKEILSNIKNMYIADMNKYVTSNFESIKIEKVYNSISSSLSLENKKFKYTIIEENADKRKFTTAIDWLCSSGMVLKSDNIKVPNKPLKVYINENSFKLFYSDVGLLSNISNVIFSDILLNKNFMYKGAIVENYIACELHSSNIPLYFWTSSATSEIDFITQTKDGVIPIEVKSSSNTKSKSLNTYIQEFNPPYSIRISSKNFGFENNIKSIPLYAVFALTEELNNLSI